MAEKAKRVSGNRGGSESAGWKPGNGLAALISTGRKANPHGGRSSQPNGLETPSGMVLKRQAGSSDLARVARKRAVRASERKAAVKYRLRAEKASRRTEES